MAQVCKWLGYYLCMRDTPKDAIHPDGAMFDAVIVWKESPKGKEKSGGMAYEVILKPAGDSPAPRPKSPPKDRPLSQEIIEKKLKEAEERRQSAELAKLQLVAKDEARRQEAAQKIAEQNKSFSEETEKKLQEKLKTGEEKKAKQIKELQERLRDHANRVEGVRKQSEAAVLRLKEKIYSKLDSAEENRQNQIKSIKCKLQEHEKHIQEVLDAVKGEEEKKKEKMIERMETTLKNREEQLRGLVLRLKEHEKHVKEVRDKRASLPPAEGVEQCS